MKKKQFNRGPTRFGVQYVYSVMPIDVHHLRGVLPEALIHIRDITLEGYPRSAGIGPTFEDAVPVLCRKVTKGPYDMVNGPSEGTEHPKNICHDCVVVYEAAMRRMRRKDSR